MSDQATPTRTNGIDEAGAIMDACNAEPVQRQWVWARILARSDAEAAREVHVHPSTVCKWENKAELDRAVLALLKEPVAAAKEMLDDAAPDAVDTLKRELRGKSAVAAANSILDRIGLTTTQKIEHRVEGKLTFEELVLELTNETERPTEDNGTTVEE